MLGRFQVALLISLLVAGFAGIASADDMTTLSEIEYAIEHKYSDGCGKRLFNELIADIANARALFADKKYSKANNATNDVSARYDELLAKYFVAAGKRGGLIDRISVAVANATDGRNGQDIQKANILASEARVLLDGCDILAATIKIEELEKGASK
ncbi:hypothetical protein RsTz2092_01830 [Deferribacterales bacterium RsTz2092]